MHAGHGERFTLDLEHPTRRIPIQRTGRPSHHLGAPDGLQVNEIDRRLPIGERQGNAVTHHANPADAERRARTESTHRQARILGWIVPIGDRESRDIHEHLRQRRSANSSARRVY